MFPHQGQHRQTRRSPRGMDEHARRRDRSPPVQPPHASPDAHALRGPVRYLANSQDSSRNKTLPTSHALSVKQLDPSRNHVHVAGGSPGGTPPPREDHGSHDPALDDDKRGVHRLPIEPPHCNLHPTGLSPQSAISRGARASILRRR